ncbi:MAG: glucosyltransferase domain-containing protein [Lachnospiraceae bacterium]|nr:glucosyltransferase domain-containing protein [Lachnospiraceae bacterium]
MKTAFTDMLRRQLKKYRSLFITAGLTCFFSYFYLMVKGQGGADAVCEGVHYYHNEDWATASARWMVRYVNLIVGKNVIIPFIVVILYCAMLALALCFLCELFEIKRPLSHVIAAALMISCPIATQQFAFLYMCLGYCLSFLLVTVAMWLSRKRKPLYVLMSVPCYLIMLGCYQSYIAMIAALGLLLFFRDQLCGVKQKDAWIDLGLVVATAFAAALINFPFSDFMAKQVGMGIISRVSDFSLKDIIENLPFTLKYSYVWFVTPFTTDVLSKDKQYLLLFLLLLAALFVMFWGQIKKKEYLRFALCLASVLLLPLAMNVCVVLFPHNGLYDIMRQQYLLLVVLFFFLYEKLPEHKSFLWMYKGGCTVGALLTACYVLSANATFILNGIIYDYTIREAGLMLGRVYELEDYVPHETPIVLGDPIDYKDIEGIYPQMFRYAYMAGGPVFWEGPYGMTTGRYWFFREWMGVDPQWIDVEEFEFVINNTEYVEMPVWPEPGSVKMIGRYAVIKTR